MIKKIVLAASLALPLVLTQGLPARAEFPSNWYVEGVQDLLGGNVVSTAIKADGSLTLSADLKSWGQLKETSVLDAARLHDGRLVAATGQQGAVYLIESGKAPVPLLQVGKDLVTTVAVDAHDRIYAAVAPGGRLYAGTAKDGLKQIYAGSEGYIWDVLPAADGHTYFVTGNGGALYELKGDKAELLYKSQESNLRTLFYDSKWGLLVGGGSRGVVYRYMGDHRMTALLEANADEVTAITGDGKGELFVAISRNQPGKDQSKSAVFHIDAGGHSELLFPLDDEAVYSLALDSAGTLFIGTGDAGRIYTIEHPLQSDRRTLSLPARSLASQVTALVPGADRRMMVFGASPATVESYEGAYRSVGVYESQVFNADLPAQWGALHVNAVIPQDTEVVAWSRSGNTQTPDATWSPWSRAYVNPSEVEIESPRSRFLQLKFELRTRNASVTPALHSFEVSYLRDNLEPNLSSVFFLQRGVFFTPHTVGNLEGPRSLEITPQVLAKLQLPRSNSEIYSELLSEKIEPPMRMIQKYQPGMLTVAWDVSDPNEDELRYEVWYQAYGQTSWKQLAGGLNQTFYSFDSSSLEDGLYRFRVYASDRLSNAQGAAYRVYHDSDLLLIDNTAPEVHNLAAKVNANQAEISFDGDDKLSPLAYAEYALDGLDGQILSSADKIVDSKHEHFAFRVTAAKGSHSLVVKLTDRLGNTSSGKVRFEVR